jgi:hypothetical protein
METRFVPPKRQILAFALALFFSALVFGVPQTPESFAQTPKTSSAKSPAGGAYYLEFRVAMIGTYGHSYVAYGRLNAKGDAAEVRYADLHPVGNYALMALGHVVPVPATTKWDPGVLDLPVASSYRVKLDNAKYSQLVSAIQRARAKPTQQWNAVTNNCNTFVGHLAETVGLRTPSDLLPSYAFVPALRDLNESTKKNQSARQ